jgi:hypothetical protein
MGRVHFLCLPKENEPKEKAPLVLACGFTALRFLSGRLTKLASLTNLSGTNLDAEDARRVSGMDATNQTGKSLILTKSRYSSTQKGDPLASRFGTFTKCPYAMPSIAELVGSA